MSDILTTIEDNTSGVLSLMNPPEVTREKIYEAVKDASAFMSSKYKIEITDADVELIARRLEARFNITMSLGTWFATEEYRPWLENSQGDIDWYYCGRYKRFLRFPWD